jgi:hypothetical protein
MSYCPGCSEHEKEIDRLREQRDEWKESAQLAATGKMKLVNRIDALEAELAQVRRALGVLGGVALGAAGGGHVKEAE